MATASRLSTRFRMPVFSAMVARPWRFAQSIMRPPSSIFLLSERIVRNRMRCQMGWPWRVM